MKLKTSLIKIRALGFDCSVYVKAKHREKTPLQQELLIAMVVFCRVDFSVRLGLFLHIVEPVGRYRRKLEYRLGLCEERKEGGISIKEYTRQDHQERKNKESTSQRIYK